MQKFILRYVKFTSLVCALTLLFAAPCLAVSQTELKASLRGALGFELSPITPYTGELSCAQALQNSCEALGLRFELQLFEKLFLLPELQIEDPLLEAAKHLSPAVPRNLLESPSAELSQEMLLALVDWVTSCKKGLTLRANFLHPNGTELRILRKNIGKAGELINTGALSSRPLFVVTLLLDPQKHKASIAKAENFGDPKAELSRIAAENFGCLAAINGGYFFNNNQPVGVLKTDGLLENAQVWKNRSAVCWNEQGEILFVDGSNAAILTQAATQKFSEAFQAGPMLVKNGAKCTSTDDINIKVLNFRHPRTIFGVCGDKIMLTVIDGRNPLHSVGTTIQETKDICLALGMKTALNLDGGGSSALWWLGELMNLPSENGVERKIPYGIVFK